ncbi:Myosin-like protein [Phytophthora palmivora]|uniref:Myosin-like protein n=1 Tax=Phytophthora palmivora TaxID=4796 RepID=A0A2P4YT84_9STRA|nr:Myosin-like protein [Phytophthora palmivora]
MATTDQFDVVWRQDALGLRFTPNEHDLPVVCQVPPNACPAVLASPLAVGDVLVAFDLQLQDQPEGMQPVRAFDQLVTVLRRAKLPVTLRFKSREKEIPSRVEESDVVRNYVFTWAPQMPLGVSLAMDPCSLHAAITAIDPNKISPAFQNLKPVLGDVLIAISPDNEEGEATRLDEMRFEDIIQTLRQFPRPCRLTFGRLVEETPSASSKTKEDNVLFPLKPLAPITRSKATSSSSDRGEEATSILNPPFLMRPQARPKSRSRAGLPPQRKQLPISMRQSFRIDAPKPTATPPMSGDGRPHAGSTSSNDGRPHSASNADDKGFYTVMYSGGAVGLQLRDCTQDDKALTKGNDKTNRTNGYTVAIRNVTDPNSAPGLEIATPDDLLMAIGQKAVIVWWC